MKKAPYVLYLSFVICSTIQAKDIEPHFTVYDFKQGLMHEQNGIYVVYKQGQDFKYKINGKCTYNHEIYSCMWKGFTFRTKPEIKSLKLHCVGQLFTPDVVGTPRDAGKKLSKMEIEIVLHSNNGLFSNPQYTIKEPDIQEQTITTTCYHNGNELINSTITIHYDQ